MPGSGAGEGGAAGAGGGPNFLLRWRGWQDRVAADPSFPYKVFIEQARLCTEPLLTNIQMASWTGHQRAALPPQRCFAL